MYTEEDEYPPLRVPDTVEFVETRIWSDGYWLDASVFRPRGLADDAGAPGVVLSHGWGGGKNSVAAYAARFAKAGMVSVIFSHDGWYRSSGRTLLLDDDLTVDAEGNTHADIRVVRELIDPDAWIRNFRAATDYLASEPGVDPTRLGAWGTSFGGGTALSCASTDDRFRAVVTQVAFLASPNDDVRAFARARSAQIARGEIDPFPTDVGGFPGMRGTLNIARMQHYDPVAAIDRLRAPALIIDAEHEELFDIRESGGRVNDLLVARGDIEVRYDVMAGIDHYGIYFDGFVPSSGAALEWFDRHL